MKLKQKPSGIWFVEFEGDDGERRRVSTNTRDKDVARLKMKDIVLGLDQPVVSAQKARSGVGRVTMKDLFDRAEKTVWAASEAKSQATIRSTIKILTPYIGDVPIEDMTYTRLEQLAADLKKDKGYAPATIKRKLDMVSKALRMATKWTDDKGRNLLAAKPPMPTIRVSNLKDRVLYGAADAKLLGKPDEERLVFEAIEARRTKEPTRQWYRLAALLRLLLDTGGRLTETINTGDSDVDFQPVMMPDGSIGRRPVIIFPRYGTKSDKPRTVPLTDAAWDALQSQRPHMGLKKVKADMGPAEPKLVFFPISQGTAWYMFNQIKEDVLAKHGVDMADVTLHTMRHTCLTRLAKGGMDLMRLQKWAGHSDPKITSERYAHLIPSNLMDGLLLLGSSNGTYERVQTRDGDIPDNVSIMEHSANRDKSGTVRLN